MAPLGRTSQDEDGDGEKKDKWLTYVGPQFNREATEAGSERQPGLLEEPVSVA